MLNEIRHAFRTLRRSPGFTMVAIFTLSLAIGANTSLFSMVHNLLLKPLVPAAPAPVVNIYNGNGERERDYRAFSWAELEAMQEPNEVFQEVGAFGITLAGISTQGTEMKRMMAFFATDNLLSVIGQAPQHGRFFNTIENQPGSGEPVVVIAHDLWQSLGGSEVILGTTIKLNHQPFTVIGVTAPHVSLGNALLGPGVWLPFGMRDQLGSPFDNNDSTPLGDPRNHSIMLMGRLQSGLSIEAADNLLAPLDQRLAAIESDPIKGGRQLEVHKPSRLSISTVPADDGPIVLIGALMLGLSGIVLFIACLNLANMMLARGSARRQEMAIRLALGASRWRVLRQLLVEGLMLSLAGGVGGLLLSLWSVDLLLHSARGMFTTMNFSFALDPSPDAALILATLGFCVFATLLFSLVPALKISRPDVLPALKIQDASETNRGGLRGFFSARNCLVMAQIALSLVMIVSAGLFFRGALNASGMQLGFDADGIAFAEVDYSLSRTDAAVARQNFLRMQESALALPAVTDAGLTNLLPYGAVSNSIRLIPAAAPISPAEDEAVTGFSGIYSAISDGYFSSLGVTILQGRDFTPLEVSDPEAPPVVIIDERMAASLFPDGNALGQRVRRTFNRADGSNPEMEIVGICAPFRHQVLGEIASRRLVVPLASAEVTSIFMVTRARSQEREAAVALLPMLRRSIQQVDPAAPLIQLQPLRDHVDKNIGFWVTRLGATLFGVFAAVALLMAVIGVYGVKAYLVARRSREIGIRMALGAKPRDIFNLVMSQGIAQTGVGLGVGLLLSLGVGQALSSMLFRVSPFDQLTFIASASLLAVSTLAACFLPARRATRVDPMIALRTD